MHLIFNDFFRRFESSNYKSAWFEPQNHNMTSSFICYIFHIMPVMLFGSEKKTMVSLSQVITIYVKINADNYIILVDSIPNEYDGDLILLLWISYVYPKVYMPSVYRELHTHKQMSQDFRHPSFRSCVLSTLVANDYEILTLYMLNFTEGTKTCIYILCNSSTLTSHRLLKFFLK